MNANRRIRGALLLLAWFGLNPLPALSQTAAQTGPKTAGEHTDTAAIFAEASRLDKGHGVPQDHHRAQTLFQQAAEMGDVAAQNQLGKYLYTGRGGTKDPQAALRWLRQAAKSGDPAHLFDLGVVLEAEGHLADAASLYSRATQAGHIDAAVSLGVLYQNGSGVDQDYDRARSLYEKAAQAGHARAQNNLGLLYVRGHGGDQDYARAADLFAAAAEQGLRQAMTNLGVLYDNGFGVAQSDETAAMWYRLGGRGSTGQEQPPLYDARLTPPPADPQAQQATLEAARAGDPVAQFLTGWLFLARGQPGDAQAAAAWFTAAAEHGHAASMANLARLHFLGTGVLQDYVRGQMWATLALASGLVEAEHLARQTGVSLTVEQMAAAQHLAALYWQNLQPADLGSRNFDFD